MGMTNDGKLLVEITKPVLIEAGLALLNCQGFEYDVGFLLFHLSRSRSTGLSVDQTYAIMEGDQKRTVGQLIQMLKQHIDVSVEMEKILHEALIARNRLIHRVLVERIEDTATDEGRVSIKREIGNLRRNVLAGSDLLRPIIDTFSAVLDGFDMEAQRKEAIDRILLSGGDEIKTN